MPKIFCFTVFVFLAGLIVAQPAAGISYSDSNAEGYVRQLYFSSREKDLPLNNGTQHYPYSPTIEGTAYFLSDSWQKGTVEYEGVIYDNIQMNYDLVTDKLVIAPEGKSIFISLFSPRITWFSYSGNRFLRIEKIEKTDPPTGFYHVLATGKVNLFAKTGKVISEKIVDNALARKFEQTTMYYIQKDGVYYKVNNKNGLLSILKEQRNGIQSVITQKKLKYRRDTENLILSAVQYYNQQ
jgi:hypothetical protein